MYSAHDEICREMFELESSRFLWSLGSVRGLVRTLSLLSLTDHRKFIELFELRFVAVEPRMTRDFLIKFECDSDRDSKNHSKLSLRRRTTIFGEIERENQLFVTMDYPVEILRTTYLTIRLLDHCVFVAIKNGEHMSKGYAFFDDRVKDVTPQMIKLMLERFTTT